MRAWRLAIIVWAAAAVISLLIAANATDAASLRFTVVKSENKKPVRNASVVLHPVNKEGRQQKGGLELKTDADGVAKVDGIPYGRLRVQVIAPGMQTYGQDFEINQAEHDFVIKLDRPKDQYSIYK